MKIRPLHDRLLIERLEGGEVKKGGIITPDTAMSSRDARATARAPRQGPGPIRINQGQQGGWQR